MKRYQMKYKIKYGGIVNDSLKILGKEFVKINNNKGKLIIKNKKYTLKENIPFNSLANPELKINILLSRDICNLSSMFNNCQSLIEFSMNDYIQNGEINYDIQEIKENYNELEDNINELGEDIGTFYENVFSEYSEISKKKESSQNINRTYFEK